MSYTYYLHPLIKQDYEDAYCWYEEKQKGLGERFIKAVRKKMDEIASQPESFGIKTNKKYQEAMIDFFPYVIVYKINRFSKEIYISSIHHTKKHPRKKYRKER